jgi:hypothetical protein
MKVGELEAGREALSNQVASLTSQLHAGQAAAEEKDKHAAEMGTQLQEAQEKVRTIGLTCRMIMAYRECARAAPLSPMRQPCLIHSPILPALSSDHRMRR